MFFQGAAADAESKSEELNRAVEELHTLLKEAGEGLILCLRNHTKHCVFVTLKYSLFSTLLFGFSVSSTANKALEEKLQEIDGATEKTVGELKERIQALEKELDNANDLLSSSKLRGQLV